MKGTINLALDTAHESPNLFRSELSSNLKFRIFLAYLKISIKLFTLHRIKKQTKENVLGYIIETFDYGTLHFLFREIFLNNTYHFKTKKRKPYIIDCGSNIGLSLIYFKLLYPKAIIYAFEPDPETFRLLEKNVKENKLRNVYLHNVALNNKTGNIDFYIDSENPGWLTMSTLYERLPDKDKINVKSMLLSSFVKSDVDFLKMDIEGAETKVFEDLIKSKKINKIKEMAVEYHLHKDNPSEFADFLKDIHAHQYKIQLYAVPSAKDPMFQDVLVYITKK